MTGGAAFGISSPDNEWLRLKPLTLPGVSLAGLFCTTAEWRAHGVVPADFGFLDLGSTRSSSERVQIPQIESVFVSLAFEGEVTILDLGESGVDPDPRELAVGVFDDEHPVPWIEQAAADQRLLVAVSDLGTGHFVTAGEWQATWSVGLVRLAAWANGDGLRVVP